MDRKPNPMRTYRCWPRGAVWSAARAESAGASSGAFSAALVQPPANCWLDTSPWSSAEPVAPGPRHCAENWRLVVSKTDDHFPPAVGKWKKKPDISCRTQWHQVSDTPVAFPRMFQ
ncbi:hypothetical protein STEG23_036572, partial [Scotinomys teguina]